MNEEKKSLNLSNDELVDALINCSESESETKCEKCPYFLVGCVDSMMSDAAGRIYNLGKQVDILTKMMKLEDDE